MNGADERRAAVAAGLLPIVRIVDRPLRWTMDERLAHYGCPGAAVAVMRGGAIDWVDGFGRRDADRPDPMGPDTVFMVASCSKPVTAVMVLQQVERGVLDLDADVTTYMKRWQVPANEFTADQPVTLRHCLSHTAGLSINGWGIVLQDGSPVPTLFDLLEGREPSKMGPVVVNKAYDGTSRYSGGGYLVAQIVLEDVLGTGFDEIAEETLFGPLGMTNSSFTQPLVPRLRGDVASGHGDDGRPHPGGWSHSSEMATGGLFSTARDYATFLLAVRAAWAGEPGSILSRATAREMLTRHERGDFGLGIRVLGDGPTRINHGGSNDGYQSETNTFLESGDGAVVLTNATSGIFLYREILNGVADVYGWPDFLLAPKKLRHLSEAELAELCGSYRIEIGIELPFIEVWADNGTLFSQVPGLRFGVQETYCDEHGVLFQQTGPFETHVLRDDSGRVTGLSVSESGVEFLRASKVDA